MAGMFDYDEGKAAIEAIYAAIDDDADFYEGGQFLGCPRATWDDRDWQAAASRAISDMWDDLTNEQLSGIYAYSASTMDMHEVIGAGINALVGGWLQAIHENGEL